MIRYALVFAMLVIIAFRDFMSFDSDVIYYIDFFENIESLDLSFNGILNQDSFYVSYTSIEHAITYKFEFGFAYLNFLIYEINNSPFFYKIALGWPILLIKLFTIKKFVFTNGRHFQTFLILYFLWLFWYFDLNAVRAGLSSTIIICTFIYLINTNFSKFFVSVYFSLAVLLGVSIHLSGLLLVTLPIIHYFSMYLHSSSHKLSLSLIKLNYVYCYLTAITTLYVCCLLFKIDIIQIILNTFSFNNDLGEKTLFYSEENKNQYFRVIYSAISWCFSIWLAVVSARKINLILKSKSNNVKNHHMLLFSYYSFLIMLLIIATLNYNFVAAKRLHELFGLFELFMGATVVNKSNNKLVLNNFIIYGYYFCVFGIFIFVNLSK